MGRAQDVGEVLALVGADLGDVRVQPRLPAAVAGAAAELDDQLAAVGLAAGLLQPALRATTRRRRRAGSRASPRRRSTGGRSGTPRGWSRASGGRCYIPLRASSLDCPECTPRTSKRGRRSSSRPRICAAATARAKPRWTRSQASPSTSRAAASPRSWARRGRASRRSCTSSPGLDRPTTGTVRIAGVELTGLDDRELTQLRRDRVGFIFQTFNLLPVLNAQREHPAAALDRRAQARPRMVRPARRHGRHPRPADATAPPSSRAASSSASRSRAR